MRPVKSRSRSLAARRAAFLDDLADADAQIFPGVFLLDAGVGDQLAELIDAQRFAHFVDGQAHVRGNERGVSGVDARRCELLRICCAVEVEPGAGGGVVLMILDAEKRNGLRAGQPSCTITSLTTVPAGHIVHGNRLRGDRIAGHNVRACRDWW